MSGSSLYGARRTHLTTRRLQFDREAAVEKPGRFLSHLGHSRLMCPSLLQHQHRKEPLWSLPPKAFTLPDERSMVAPRTTYSGSEITAFDPWQTSC